MHIDRRKNDTVRKGHYTALGRSKDPALVIVVQLRTQLRIARLAVHPFGQEISASGSLRSMPLLFPLTRCAKGGVTVVTGWSWIGRARVSKRAIGLAAPSRRRGASLPAFRASRYGRAASLQQSRHVDEKILYLQCCHGQALPARAYMYLTSPARILETFEAFALCMGH